MTGNIVGEEFENYVFDQIQIRQSLQGTGLNSNRTPQQLQYLNNTNAWIKLASSVSVDSNKGLERLKKIIGNSANNYQGYLLAKDAILFNGLSALEGKNYIQRAGIVTNNSQLWNNTSAYGLGGSNFGLQPMPGIIGANVRTLNRGSIRKSQVTLKAFNRYQFEVIELLYLRLGFTMMLEWGNDKYIDPKGELQPMGNTLIEEVWFGDTSYTQLEMLKEIEKKREQYFGNYDGFFGRVSNFTWSFESDGSYSITIDLITLGDVIESLQANNPVQAYNTKKIKENKESLTKEDALLSDLKDSPIVTSAENDVISAWLFDNISKPELWDLNGEYPNYFDLSKSVEKELGTDNSKKIPAQYRYFTTFQELLDKVNESLIPEIDNEGGKIAPILGIYKEVVNNYVNYYPNQFSTDPRICLIKPNFGNANIKDFILPEYFSPLKNYVGIEDPAIYGQLMHVYLNFDFISKCITSSSSTSDNVTKISLFTFLQKICNGINNALGGVNKIEPIISDDYYITFIDQNPIPGLVKDKPKKEIVDLEVFGYNKENNTSNFVKSIDFQTKITPDLATQITIGATAAGSAVKNEDATAFSKWSEGLVDRFNKKYIEPSPINSSDLSKYEIWRREAIEKFSTYPEAKVKTKQKIVVDQTSGITVTRLESDYRGSKIKQNKYFLKRNVNLFNPKGEELTEQQFLIEYLRDKEKKEKEGIIDQSEFNKIFTTNWAFYISECFAGKMTFTVDRGERVYTTNINTRGISQAIGLGGVDASQAAPKIEITSTTTKEITSDTHRYIQFDPNFIARANNVYRNYLVSWYKNLYNKSSNPSPSSLPGFIPLTFNIGLQGISGVKIYNKLNINQQFLPKQYPEALKFLITGVDHTISDNTWETKLSTLSIPNTRPEALEELIKNVDPNVTDYGVLLPEEQRGPKPNGDKLIVLDNRTTNLTQQQPIKEITVDELLKDFHPQAKSSFTGFFKELESNYKGYTILVNSLQRDFAKSNLLSEQNPLNAAGGSSRHNYNTAIDFNVTTPQGEQLKKSTGKNLWVNHGFEALAKKYNLRWGGTFDNYQDYVHFAWIDYSIEKAFESLSLSKDKDPNKLKLEV